MNIKLFLTMTAALICGGLVLAFILLRAEQNQLNGTRRVIGFKAEMESEAAA
jgi:hypothetical protein